MKLLIVANWKCNPTTLAEAKRLFNSVKKELKNIKNVEIVICPPFVYLPVLGASASAKGYGGLASGSQDCFWEQSGAYTGEISPRMLKDLGCQYVITGHSERRKYQNETDLIINRKIKAALKEGLKVILCIEMISQIRKDLRGISEKDFKNLILAFEPVSAIGTGRPYSVELAKRVNSSIQRIFEKNIPIILYGGSVDSGNAKNYIKEAGFQGLLVGGASLDSKEFVGIIKAVS